MPETLCPKGHDSSESDFCSVCGAKMQMPAAGTGSAPNPTAPAATGPTCPDCSLARDAAGGIFCEFCGYNFQTGAHGELRPAVHPAPPEASAPTALPSIIPAPPAPSAPSAVPAPEEPPAPPAYAWTVVIEVDPALKTDESPAPPAAFEPLTVALTAESSLIGRRSDKRGVFPEIALDADDAVSHRHALLNKLPDGGLTLRDIGSSNGTSLNGTPVTPLTDMALKPGDQVTLGHWTRLCIR